MTNLNWFVVICGDLLLICGDLWWFAVICGDLWWIYGPCSMCYHIMRLKMTMTMSRTFNEMCKDIWNNCIHQATQWSAQLSEFLLQLLRVLCGNRTGLFGNGVFKCSSCGARTVVSPLSITNWTSCIRQECWSGVTTKMLEVA